MGPHGSQAASFHLRELVRSLSEYSRKKLVLSRTSQCAHSKPPASISCSMPYDFATGSKGLPPPHFLHCTPFLPSCREIFTDSTPVPPPPGSLPDFSSWKGAFPTLHLEWTRAVSLTEQMDCGPLLLGPVLGARIRQNICHKVPHEFDK